MTKKKTLRKIDVVAAKERHRTLATEKAFIPNYPTKLSIYKQLASSYWWVRYFSAGKVLRKTTKTESKQEAIAFAKAFFNDANIKQASGLAVTTPSNFGGCANGLLEELAAELAREKITKITYDNTKYRFDKAVVPFFRSHEVGQIDYHLLNGFLAQLSTQTPKFSLSTISAYMGLVRKVLVYAARRRFIHGLPEFPKVGVEDIARGWFRTRLSVDRYS